MSQPNQSRTPSNVGSIVSGAEEFSQLPDALVKESALNGADVTSTFARTHPRAAMFPDMIRATENSVRLSLWQGVMDDVQALEEGYDKLPFATTCKSKDMDIKVESDSSVKTATWTWDSFLYPDAGANKVMCADKLTITRCERERVYTAEYLRDDRELDMYGHYVEPNNVPTKLVQLKRWVYKIAAKGF